MTPAPAVAPDALSAQLIAHEGIKLAVYQDSLGYYTLGVGRLVDPRKDGGISTEEAFHLLANDIARCRRELDHELPWWRGLDEIRQRVLIDLCFNLGIQNLLGFHNTLASFSRHEWTDAAAGLRGSKWATQVQPSRVNRLIQMLLTGKEQP